MEEKTKSKVLEYLVAKGKNKRIDIILYERSNKEKVFRVKTKTLIDFKTRNILETDNLWSIESFVLLRYLFSVFLEDPKVKNRLILKEINNIEKFKVGTTF